jgi:acetyl esterase/lipase
MSAHAAASWTLLICGLVFAVLTANSLWPLRRPGSLGLVLFFPSWLVSELPLHFAALQLGVVAFLGFSGGIDLWPGRIGLVLTAFGVAGMLRHARMASETALLVERGLKGGLGPDYRDRIHPDERINLDPTTSWRRLATIIPWQPGHLERTRNLVYHKIGKHDLRLDVWHKRGHDRAGKRPCILYVHGGGWVIGNKDLQGLTTVHELAAAGWVCFSMNYRLSPRATFPDHLHDVKRAIAWVRQHAAEYGGDPGHIVLIGNSAGAHLAALAALTPNATEYQRDFPDVDTSVQGCVAYYGVYDFAEKEVVFPHRAFRRLLLERIVMKRRFAEAPEEFEKASPMFRVGPQAPPFMVLHGDRDSLAPVKGARRFVERLRAASTAPVTFVELHGAQHAFEVFPSLRSAPAVHAVHRFCAWTWSEACRAAAESRARRGG